MNTKVYYWRDIYGDLEKFAPYFSTIERLMQGERSGLRLERLRSAANPSIYSIRVNERDRLLFTFHQDSICLLDVVLNHDYDKSVFVRHPHKVQAFVKTMIDNAEFIWEEEALALAASSSKPSYAALDYYQHQFIHLNPHQQSVLSTPVPGIVVGPAGSGKTSTAWIYLSQAVKALSGRLLYVTRSQGLVTSLQKMWHEGYPEDSRVDFKTYAELYGVEDDQTRFLTWYEKLPSGAGAGEALSAEEIWRECRIRSGCASDEAYFALGERQSRLSRMARQQVCGFYRRYLAFLGEESILSVRREDLAYDLVVVDEAQDLSHAQLQSLYQGSRRQIIFMLGSHQLLFDEVSKLDYLKSLLYADGLPEAVLHLPTCHRSAETVIGLANGLIRLKGQVAGGATDKAEGLMTVADELRGQGAFELRPTAAITDLVGEHPDVAIITLAEWKDEAKRVFGSSLVFTVAEIKGLEFHTVLLWKLLTDSRAQEIGRHFSALSDGGGALHRAKRGQARSEYVNVCDAWITAVTRAKQRVVWLDDARHELASIYAYLASHVKTEVVDIPTARTWDEVHEALMAAGAHAQAAEIHQKHLSRSPAVVSEPLPSTMATAVVAEEVVSYAGEYQKLKVFLSSKKRLNTIRELTELLKQDGRDNIGRTFLYDILQQEDGLAVLKTFYEKHPQVISESIWYRALAADKSLMHDIFAKDSSWAIALMKLTINHLPDDMIIINSPLSLHRQLYRTLEGREFLLALYVRNPKLLHEEMEANRRSSELLCLLTEGASKLPHSHGLRKKLEKLGLKFNYEQSLGFKKMLESAYKRQDKWVLGLMARWGIADQGICKDLFSIWMKAVSDNNLPMVMILLENGANINACTQEGGTALYIAAQLGYIQMVRYLCEQGADINLASNCGSTPLIIAIYQEQFEIALYLCEHGADKEQVDNYGVTPLMVATHKGDLAIVEYLCKQGVNKNQSRHEGATPLYYAAQEGHLEIVRYLCEQGADKDLALNDGSTALYIAAYQGKFEIVRYLCEQGADKDQAKDDGATPLFIAAQLGYLGIVRYLCDHGANKDLMMNDGATPLYIAVKQRNFKIVRYLCNQGASIDLALSDDTTPLFIAAQLGYLDLVQELCIQGADIHRARETGVTPLLIAVSKGHFDIVCYLCAQGANLDQATPDGATPLFIAVFQENLAILRYLCEQGANKDLAYHNGATPLYIAANHGNIEIVDYLCEQGADKESALDDGSTPLCAAIQQGHLTVVQHLCARGANKDLYLADGATLLHLAVQQGNLEMVEYLCDQGMNMDRVTSNGSTPLYIAAQQGNLAVVQYLCERGANKDLGRHSGTTPLYIAVAQGNLAMVQYLCAQGADWRLRPVGGISALTLARNKGYREMAEYLVSLSSLSFGLASAGMFASMAGSLEQRESGLGNCFV